MGVRGLETYLERNNPRACYIVNIRDIILAYRNETGRQPKIVIDGLALTSHLYNKNLPWISGGQLKEFEEIVREFVAAFVDLGAALVVFLDGPPAPTKKRVWIKRRLDKLKDCYILFDDLMRGINPLQIQRERQSYIPANAAAIVTRGIRSSNGCEVRRSILECDQEIAIYALENECLAILGQDSDFVILNGARYYWSLKNFDLESMTTLNYDSIGLAYSLNIQPGHLPLVASLMGNDIVPYELLLGISLADANTILLYDNNSVRFNNYVQPYKRRLVGSRRNPGHYIDFRTCIERVGNFVRNLPVGSAIHDYLPRIAREVFADESKSAMLSESLNSYNLHLEKPEDCNTDGDGDHWLSVLRLVGFQHRNGKFSSAVYGIVHDLRYWCSTGMEDFREDDLPPALQISRKLRQHIYGILLFEKPLASNQAYHEVRELTVTGPESLDDDFIVKTIPPNVAHPGLAALWNEADKSIDDTKWGLVCDAVQICPKSVNKLPNHVVVPSIAIHYLLKQGLVVSKWEMDAIVSSIVLLRGLSTDRLKSLPLILDSRSLRLYTVLTKAFGFVILLLSVCGDPLPSADKVASNYQDGKLFQTKYSDAKEGFAISQLCDYKVDNVETCNLIMEFIGFTG